MHVLIATDKFKGSLSASEAAEAMSEGVRAACPESNKGVRKVPDTNGTS
jgi:glycerate kinase